MFVLEIIKLRVIRLYIYIMYDILGCSLRMKLGFYYEEKWVVV